MCGIFAISGHPEAARMAYFGLYALQHRGQESAGIATYDGANILAHMGMGLVPDVFDEPTLGQELRGDTAIGHVRYSTTGVSAKRNAQPLIVRVRGIEIALAHNGNLTNAAVLRQELEERGAIFQTTSDTEIFVHLIAHDLAGKTLEEAILGACERVQGAYALVILSEGRIIALRDPHGFHPLSLGKVHEAGLNRDAYVFASETCAFDLLEAELIRDVEPGEMLVVEGGKLTSYKLPGAGTTPTRQCIFELVYFARPDSIVFGEDVYRCRKHMGFELAKEATTDAELVMPFPDSGVYAALGFAQAAHVPYEHAYIRNHYVGRTFIQPSQTMRNFSVRVKLNPVRSMIVDRRICIVDDSIVRGTTVRTRVAKLRELGAREVHFRVSCPPLKHPCFYGINFSSRGELVAANHPVESLPGLLNLDSLHYLSIEGLLNSVSNPEKYCLACFNGDYPVACGGNCTGC
ncbi:MAG: amidophosphoribosyltransferase [Bilophila sp.]